MSEINVETLVKKWEPMLEHETVDPIKNQKVKNTKYEFRN